MTRLQTVSLFLKLWRLFKRKGKKQGFIQMPIIGRRY